MSGTAPLRLLARSASVTASGQLGGQIALAGVYMLAARAGTPASFGLVVAAIGVATLLVDVVDLGSNALLTRELASGRASPGTYLAILRWKVCASAAVASVWAAVAMWADLPGGIALVGCYVVTQSVTSCGLAALRSRRSFARVAVLSIGERVVNLLVATACFAVNTSPVTLLAVSFVSASATSALVTTAVAIRQLGASRPVPGFSTAAWLRRSGGFGMSTVASDLQYLDVVLVRLTAGPVAAGMFAAANRLLGVLIMLPVQLGYVLLPTLSGSPDTGSRRRLTLRAGVLVVAATSVIVAVPLLSPTFVLTTLFGSQYRDAAPVLTVYCLAVLIVAANQPLATHLQAAGRDRAVGVAMLVLCLLNVPVVLALSAALGAAGGAGGYLILQMGLLIVFLWLWRAEGRTSSNSEELVTTGQTSRGAS